MDNKKIASELVLLAKAISGAADWSDHLVPLSQLRDRRDELLKEGKVEAGFGISETIRKVQGKIRQLEYETQHISDYYHSDVSYNVRHLGLQIPEQVIEEAKQEEKEWKNAIRNLEKIKSVLEETERNLR